MTFEEFFKKKKIDLGLLNAAEPTLFAEFELHYNLMGEKELRVHVDLDEILEELEDARRLWEPVAEDDDYVREYG